MSAKKRTIRTPAQIRGILADLSQSGLSRPQFAAKHGVPLSTLHAWARKYDPAPTTAPELIPVGTIGAPASAIELELPGGEVLRVGPGVRREDLQAVLEALRRC